MVLPWLELAPMPALEHYLPPASGAVTESPEFNRCRSVGAEPGPFPRDVRQPLVME